MFIAIGQVDLDAGEYPNIAQWKKLVMSYSEATQQRLHFICFNFKLIHQFGYFTFFLPFFSVPLPSLCPCLPHPLPSGSLPPSLPALPLSLPVSFLHSLTTYHSSRHCLPSLTPSIPPCLFSSVPPCISLSSTLLPFLYAFHPSLPSSITPLPGPLSPS